MAVYEIRTNTKKVLYKGEDFNIAIQSFYEFEDEAKNDVDSPIFTQTIIAYKDGERAKDFAKGGKIKGQPKFKVDETVTKGYTNNYKVANVLRDTKGNFHYKLSHPYQDSIVVKEKEISSTGGTLAYNLERAKSQMDKLYALNEYARFSANADSGGELTENDEKGKIYLGEVKTFLKRHNYKKPLSMAVFKELEHSNYHVLNNALGILGYYGGDMNHRYREGHKEAPEFFLNPSLIKAEYTDLTYSEKIKRLQLLKEQMENSGKATADDLLMVDLKIDLLQDAKEGRYEKGGKLPYQINLNKIILEDVNRAVELEGDALLRNIKVKRNGKMIVVRDVDRFDEVLQLLSANLTNRWTQLKLPIYAKGGQTFEDYNKTHQLKDGLKYELINIGDKDYVNYKENYSNESADELYESYLLRLNDYHGRNFQNELKNYAKGGWLQEHYKEQKKEIEKIKNYGKGEYEVAWLDEYGSREYAQVKASNWEEAVEIIKKGERLGEKCMEGLEIEVGIDAPDGYLGRFPTEDISNPNKNYPTYAKGGDVYKQATDVGVQLVKEKSKDGEVETADMGGYDEAIMESQEDKIANQVVDAIPVAVPFKAIGEAGSKAIVGDSRGDARKKKQVVASVIFAPHKLWAMRKARDKARAEAEANQYAKGGGISGRYSSVHDFVSRNNLEKDAENIFGKNWEADDDMQQIRYLAGNNYGVEEIDYETLRDMRSDDYIKVYRYAKGGKIESVLRKSYNDIMANSKVGEHQQVLDCIGNEIDKVSYAKGGDVKKLNLLNLGYNPKTGYMSQKGEEDYHIDTFDGEGLREWADVMVSKDYEMFSKKERKEIEKEIKYLEDEQLIWNTKASAMGTRIGKGYAKGGNIKVTINEYALDDHKGYKEGTVLVVEDIDDDLYMITEKPNSYYLSEMEVDFVEGEEIYQDFRRSKYEYSKGGITEKRVYAIDPRDERVKDISWVNELTDIEFMYEAEDQGLVWSSMDSYMDSNERRNRGHKNLIVRTIDVGGVQYKKGGEVATVEAELERAMKHYDFDDENQQWEMIVRWMEENYPDREDLIDEIEKRFKYAEGGALSKEFKFDKNFVVYVPSTSDVSDKISPKELDARVKEVKKYVATEFGGYTETETEGGYRTSKGEIVEEEVVKVSVFSKNKDWKAKENKVVDKVKNWANDWGQEAVGFEHEGDLYYVDGNGVKKSAGGTVKRKKDKQAKKKEEPRKPINIKRGRDRRAGLRKMYGFEKGGKTEKSKQIK